MSDTKTPEQMAEDFASEKIGKSWQLGKGSAWLPAITTEQRFDQCVHAFLAGYEAARQRFQRRRIVADACAKHGIPTKSSNKELTVICGKRFEDDLGEEDK